MKDDIQKLILSTLEELKETPERNEHYIWNLQPIADKKIKEQVYEFARQHSSEEIYKKFQQYYSEALAWNEDGQEHRTAENKFYSELVEYYRYDE